MNFVSCVVIFLSFRTNTEKNASFQHSKHRWYQFKRWISVAVAVAIYNWCSKCPPWARTQARRRVRHWFTATQMVVIKVAPLLYQWLQRVVDVTSIRMC